VSRSKPTRYLWLLVPHLAAILVLNLTVRLAFWQLDRADEKAELLERWARSEAVSVESKPLADLPDLSIVTARGRFEPDRHVLLDNQTRNNHPGVHVFSLFTPANGAAPFLVNRGWQPWFRTSGEWPEFETSSELVEIRGRVTRPPQTGLRLGEALPLDPDRWPNLMTYLELEQVRKVFGDRLADRIVLLDPDHPFHLSGDEWPRVNMGPDRHRGYAFQWAAISLAVLVLWVGLSLRYFVFKKRSP